MPKPGDVLYVGETASVQFKVNPIVFRVVRVLNIRTYEGWVWLDGHQLNREGRAVTRRQIWVQPAGLRPAVGSAARTTPAARTRPKGVVL